MKLFEEINMGMCGMEARFEEKRWWWAYHHYGHLVPVPAWSERALLFCWS